MRRHRTLWHFTWLLGVIAAVFLGSTFPLLAVVPPDSGEPVQQTQGSSDPLVGDRLLQVPGHDHAKPDYVPGQLIVKYKDVVQECVHCLLKQKKAFKEATADHNDSLDRLHAKYHVKRAKPIFRTEAEEDKLPNRALADLKLHHHHKFKTIKQKFPQRTKRAPTDTTGPDLSHVYLLEVPEETNIEVAAADFAQDPRIAYAHPNYIVHAQLTPNDPYYSTSGSWGQPYDDLWGLKKINAAGAWDRSTGSPAVVVAVVDTGVDWTHWDFADNVWENPGEFFGNGLDDDANGYPDDVRGYDFYSNDSFPMDENGHGTHVGGTIGAQGNNLEGVAGVNWNIEIMAVRFLGPTGSGDGLDGVDAIMYATDNGADVINNSWGGSSAQVIDDAVSYAHAAGVVVVTAAGNSASDALLSSPARSADTITVSASDVNDQLASFSNRGQKIDVAAPGVDILSLKAVLSPMCGPAQTVGTRYCRVSGTSMSSPHVAGLAALLLARNPSLTNEQIRQTIRATAFDLAPAGRDLSFGYGRIAADQALLRADTGVPVAYLSEPKQGQTIFGTVAVGGQAWGPGFASARVDIGSTPVLTIPPIWMTRCSRSTPVLDGTVCSFSTSSLTDGKYALRLTVTDAAAKSYVFEVYDVNLDNVVSEIATPTPGPYNVTALQIVGSATVRAGVFSSYKIEWSSAATPTAWNLITTSTTPVTNGLLGVWDTSALPIGEYNLRLTVNGSTQDSVTVKLALDWELVSGWPKVYTNSYQGGEIALGDVAGDEDLEIIFSVGNLLHVTTIDGTELPGFPKVFDQDVMDSAVLGPEFRGITAVDMDGDRKDEIVFADSVYWQLPIGSYADRVMVWVLKGDGSSMPGWPFTVTGSNYFSSGTIVGDVDQDGRKEIFIALQDEISTTQKVYGLRDDGSGLPGWPQVLEGEIIGLGVVGYQTHAVIVADITGDSHQEVVASNVATGKIFAWHSNGAPVEGWPIDTAIGLPPPAAVCGEYNIRGLAAIDVDHDGKKELLAEQDEKANRNCLHSLPHTHRQFLLDGDGTPLPGWPKATSQGGMGGQGFSVADVNQDGLYDILYKSKEQLLVWDVSGNALPGWPQSSDATTEPPAVANINATETPKLIVSNWANFSGSLQGIQIFAADGTLVWQRGRGFGIENYLLLRRSVVADLDRDGKLELVSIKPWSARNHTELYVWRLASSSVVPGTQAWTTLNGNPGRTGEYPAPMLILPPEVVNHLVQAQEGTLLQLTFQAVDPDDDSPTLGASGLPEDATFTDHGDGSGTFRWTPSYDFVSSAEGSKTVSVTLTATDPGSLSDSETLAMTVQNVNRLPILTVSPTPPFTMTETSSLTFAPLTFQVTATDPDGNDMQLLIDNKPPLASFPSSTTGTGTVSATFTWDFENLERLLPYVGNCTTSTFSPTFRVWDAGGGVTGPGSAVARLAVPITLQKYNANHPPIPIASILGDTTRGRNGAYVGPGKTIYLTGSTACDPDGHSLRYTWAFLRSAPAGFVPTPSTFPLDSTTANQTTTAPSSISAETTLFFKLTVKDVPPDGPQLSRSSPELQIIDKPGCWIATAAYGSPLAPELNALRAYRDQVVLTTPFGQQLVSRYYHFSPPVARIITEHENLRRIVRWLLQPLVRWAHRQVQREGARPPEGG